MLAYFNLEKIGFSERGSLLLWLPAFLVLYYPKLDKSNYLTYAISALVLFFSNKRTTFLAFFTTLRSKVFYLIGLLGLALSFVFKQKLKAFWLKSMLPRLFIWKSSFFAFFNKILFGHGLGTFALDFPIYRAHASVLGGRVDEQVVHGHSNFAHFGFELGLLGLFILAVFFYLIYLNAPRALLPVFVISIFDSSLFTVNQFLLASLIFAPFIKDLGVFEKLFRTFSSKLKSLMMLLGFVLVALVMAPSLIGHHFYIKKQYSKAIQWDKDNGLYYFMRGNKFLNKDPKKSEVDFKKATELCPSVSYFYGFLAASQLANGKRTEAELSIDKAIQYDGNDGYWYLIKAFVNYEDKDKFKELKKKALKRNPEIKVILKHPELSSAQLIGGRKRGDIRVSSFYRRGEKVFYPIAFPVYSK